MNVTNKLMLTLICFISAQISFSQAKLVMNGGIISLNNGANLVIGNADNTAIVYNGSGYIESEEPSNKIIWNIGAGNRSNYFIPFGNSSGFLPLSFNASSGIGDGNFIFNTYATTTWKNSDELPSGVTNIDANGSDNSAKVIDRFWQIEPQLYTTNPDLNNLIITYSDNEYATPNTITEPTLIAQRWNNVTDTWSDFIPSSSINTVANTIMIAAVPGSQLFDWWTMVDGALPLPLVLINFSAQVENKKVVASWQTSSEQNTKYFEVWKSTNLTSFDSVGRVAAGGASSGLLNYRFTDAIPFSGISYYRLKIVDMDGKFLWSKWAQVIFESVNRIIIYPNPSHNYLTLSAGSEIANKKPVAFIYDGKGSLIHSFTITNSLQPVNISNLPVGAYQIRFSINGENHSIPFIKK